MDRFLYTIDGGRVAGRPAPGFAPWDLASLRGAGFTLVVSFECERIDSDAIRAAGMDHVRICVEDFTAPTLDQLREFNELVDARVARGEKVLAHCWAGRGRTGTFLSSRLIWQGRAADDAIREVRGKILASQGTLAGAIEESQEAALHAFEGSLRDPTARPRARRRAT